MGTEFKSNTIGGISAIVEGTIYIVGIVLFFTVFEPLTDESKSGLEKLTYIIDHKLIYQAWMNLICVVFGVVLVPLVISINNNFRLQTTYWTQIAPVFGFIWSGLIVASGMIAVIGIDTISNSYELDTSSALTSWQTIEIIQYGLGGGIEVIGGIWVFLISISGIKLSVFHKFLNYLGLIVGVTGILTIIPTLNGLGIVFGITQIIWFIWLGIEMVKNGSKSLKLKHNRKPAHNTVYTQ